jgi:Rrf2 family protein
MTAGGMKLSTKGDYGVRAMIALAKRWGEGPVQRHEIAQRRQIPESYLDHLLGQLRRAGFVRSTRGPGGGHELTRPPEEICLLHVLEALEGSLAPMRCVESDVPEEESICGQAWVWQEIYAHMREKLAATSLADLVEHEREHERETAQAGSYSI